MKAAKKAKKKGPRQAQWFEPGQLPGRVSNHFSDILMALRDVAIQRFWSNFNGSPW